MSVMVNAKPRTLWIASIPNVPYKLSKTYCFGWDHRGTSLFHVDHNTIYAESASRDRSAPNFAEDRLPKADNIKFVKRANDCYDLGAFAEVLTKNDLYKRYNRFITMNASIRGPFLPYYATGCWSDMYLSRLTEKNKLVGMTLNCKPVNHVQSMIWAIDRVGLEVLLFPSEELQAKFKAGIKPFREGEPVPPMEIPGINHCPHEYWKAVTVEHTRAKLFKKNARHIRIRYTKGVISEPISILLIPYLRKRIEDTQLRLNLRQGI
ncbi:hypothetical protein M7I_7502 [Glarea lozoyensis 74030]|uniref:Uncharacterized protein n=1 Tax=Glarea lozoyensis (strain ATCC 74030 / MF5533) TaxID=1104152 RepID=H0EXG6_GLAL7|nr:hypothetical protein M7I_7502 [Glarea lozoyensis 74030]